MLQHNCGFLSFHTHSQRSAGSAHSGCIVYKKGKGLNWKSGNWSFGPGCVINLLEAQFPYLKNDVGLMISEYFSVLKM